jgi:hypothetical protein
MGLSRRLRVALGAILIAAGTAAETPAAPPTDLQKAQTALEQSAFQAGQAMLKAFKDEPVAWLDLRPAVENAAASANVPLLQGFLLQAFLKEGVLLFPFEQERKLDVKYKDGKLAKSIWLGADDLKVLSDRKVKYFIVPQLLARDSGSAVTMTAYDVDKAQVALESGVGPIPTKKFPLTALCANEILPPLNVHVLTFAAANFGRTVDRGECWDVPAHPLHADGAKVDGYAFGKEISWETGLPGDVITFGTSGATGGHVVVLFRWAKARAEATLLHQNWNNKRLIMIANLGMVETNKPGQKFALWRPQK